MRIGIRRPHPTQRKSARKINGTLYLFTWGIGGMRVYRATGSDRKPWLLIHSL